MPIFSVLAWALATQGAAKPAAPAANTVRRVMSLLIELLLPMILLLRPGFVTTGPLLAGTLGRVMAA